MISDLATLWRSFAGGEIAPELYGRLDLQKYQTGLARCRNFIVLPHGPVQTRPGTEYVLHTKYRDKQARLVPFVRSGGLTFVLEFGDSYIRFHTNGGTVLESAKNISAITQASPGVFTSNAHGFSDGDWVFLASIGGMTALNTRFGVVANKTTNTFQLLDLAGSSISTAGMPAYTSGGTASRVYEIASPYDADAINLLDIHYAQSVDVLTLVHPGYEQQELRRITDTNWSLGTINFDPDISAPTGVTVTATNLGDTDVTYEYAVTAVSAATGKESFISASDSDLNDLSKALHYNTITWGAVTGAARYNVYRKRSGLFCYIGQAVGTSFVDDYISPDTSTVPPESGDPFTGTGKYPAAVSYFEQRRVFGGSNDAPQNIWMTRSGTDSDMSSSTPSRSDDAIAFRVASREDNAIRHVVPLADLLVLTSRAVWRLWSQNSDVITPSTISVKPEAYRGANNVQPAVTGNSVLFGAARGGHVSEVRYSWENSGYRVEDISLMAPHLFDGYEIKDLAYMDAPYPVAWFVRSDGLLLGVTYIPEQQVLGWHWHETDGEMEACAVVPEGGEDRLYVIAKRTINSQVVRYIERLHSPYFEELGDAFHVDSGKTYSGSPADEITGLHHLEGETVSVLVDGAVHPDLTVENGAITLQVEGSTVQIGLPYTCDLQLLPVVYEGPAYGQHVQKNVNAVHLRMNRSSGVFAGPSFEKLTELKQRTNEPYGTPPELVSGVRQLVVKPQWGPDGTVCIRQTKPLPLTIQAVAVEVAVGD